MSANALIERARIDTPSRQAYCLGTAVPKRSPLPAATINATVCMPDQLQPRRSPAAPRPLPRRLASPWSCHYGLPQTWADLPECLLRHQRAARWRNRKPRYAATDDRPWPFDPGLLLQSIPSAVFAVDERLRFRFANSAAEAAVRRELERPRRPHALRVRGPACHDNGADPAGTDGRQQHLRLRHRTRAITRRDGRRWTAISAWCPSCPSTCSSCCIPARWRAGSTSRSRTGARPARSPASPPPWRTRSRIRSPASVAPRSFWSRRSARTTGR